MEKFLYWPIVDIDIELLPDPNSTPIANQRENLYHELNQLTKDLTDVQQRRLYMRYYLEMSNEAYNFVNI